MFRTKILEKLFYTKIHERKQGICKKRGSVVLTNVNYNSNRMVVDACSDMRKKLPPVYEEKKPTYTLISSLQYSPHLYDLENDNN